MLIGDHCFVMRIILHANVVYFICILLRCLQFPMVLYHNVQVAAQGRERETSGFQGIQCGMFINYRTHVYDHKLTLVWPLNVVSFIIIRFAVSFALYSF
jgi:hypothetical protein